MGRGMSKNGADRVTGVVGRGDQATLKPQSARAEQGFPVLPTIPRSEGASMGQPTEHSAVAFLPTIVWWGQGTCAAVRGPCAASTAS